MKSRHCPPFEDMPAFLWSFSMIPNVKKSIPLCQIIHVTFFLFSIKLS